MLHFSALALFCLSVCAWSVVEWNVHGMLHSVSMAVNGAVGYMAHGVERIRNSSSGQSSWA